MSRQIQSQRAYRIPKESLNHFLVAVYMNFNNSKTHYEASYIFDEGEKYCIVLNEYGLGCTQTLEDIKEWADNYE